MTFWIVAGLMALAVAAPMALVLLRARDSGGSVDSVDVALYRDQLASVDRDLARGTVSEDEAEQLRTEIKRRLLEADRVSTAQASSSGEGPPTLSGAVAMLSIVLVIAGSLGLYSWLGAPGYPDLPRAERLAMAEEAYANRPSQAEAEASLPPSPAAQTSPDHSALVEQLRSAVTERPDDLEGLRLLARNEAILGNFTAAHTAQGSVLRVLGDDATARDFADMGDLLVLAAGGYVSPEAEDTLNAALERDPGNGVARYYLGLMQLQTGRPDRAFRIWEALLRVGPPDAPWIPPIRAQILEAAFRAGIDYTLPPVAAPSTVAPGPSAADIAAAEEMTPAQRMEMIQGMVSGLSERLATEGGPPEEWARLIRALGVLGQRERAAAIWDEAQRVFPDEVAIIPVLRAARDAGVAE